MSLRDFRNVRFFHASGAWPDSEAALSAALEPAAFKPCAAYAERSMGFEAPVEGAGDALCRSIAGADLLRLRLQTRVLPTAVVKESLVERVDAFKQRMQRDPNRSEKRELKEDVYGQLLPQALLKSDRISACFLRQESVLVVGSVTDKVVEEFIETLRRGLAGIQFAPLASRRAPVELMTKIFMGDGPANLQLGRECRMRNPGEAATSVSWMDVDLGDPAVQRHVKSGLRLDRLGITFDGVVRFVLDPDLGVRKLRLDDVDGMDEIPDEDPLARFDADFVEAAGVLKRLLGGLEKQLGGWE